MGKAITTATGKATTAATTIDAMGCNLNAGDAETNSHSDIFPKPHCHPKYERGAEVARAKNQSIDLLTRGVNC
jgi:hypothetical protein